MGTEQNQNRGGQQNQQQAQVRPVPTAPVQAAETPVTPAPTVAIDMAQLVALVTENVRASLAPQQAQSLLGDGGGEVLGKAIAAGISAAQRRQVTVGEYMQQPDRNAFHPDPATTTKIPEGRHYYQNGSWLNATTLTDLEIELFNKIQRGGRYMGRTVEVIFREEGTETNVVVRWKSGTRDEQNEFARHIHGTHPTVFANVLQAVVDEQAAEDTVNSAATARQQDRRPASGQFTAGDFAGAAAAGGKKPWEQ